MRFGRHEEANTSSLGLIIAAIVFASAFIGAEVVVSPKSTTDPSGGGVYDAQATSALDVLVNGAGATSNGTDWAADPDHMTRFGLALDGDKNFLDFAKIQALRSGNLTANATNNAPDYPEVRAAMGVKAGDVHLRTYPVLPTLSDPRWTKEQTGRVAYFGAYTGGATAANMTTAYTKTSSSLNVSATVTNQGSAPAVYAVSFALAKSTGDDQEHGDHGNQDDEHGQHGGSHDHEDLNGDGYDDGHHDDDTDHDTGITEDRHTRLLAPGESQTVWTNFWALPSWEDDAQKVKISLEDEFGNAAKDLSGNSVGPIWLRQKPPSASGSSFDIIASADDLYYVTGAQVKFDVDHYTGEDNHVSGTPTARFVLVGPNGNEWSNSTVTLPTKKNSVYTYTCANCTTVGNYTIKVWDATIKRVAIDQVYVSAAKMFTAKSTLNPLAAKEIGYMADLASTFNPTRYDAATNPGGDVFADDVNGPSDITGVLSRYQTLVIGSEISQTALTPSATKNGIADWVTKGGNLIVLGTVTQQSRWLQPIYQAAQTNANGGISAPDPTHPILTSPERLAYTRYSDNGRAWEIKNGQPFTNVLTRGSDAQSTTNTLAVSNPGAFNNGTVVLTSYEPAALTAPQDDLEGKRFLHNLMSQSYTMLFLDYGPPIPPGVSVGSDARLVAVPHPNVPGAVVEVRLVMYYFG